MREWRLRGCASRGRVKPGRKRCALDESCFSHSAHCLRPGSTRPRPAQPGKHHSRH